MLQHEARDRPSRQPFTKKSLHVQTFIPYAQHTVETIPFMEPGIWQKRVKHFCIFIGVDTVPDTFTEA